MIVDVLKRWISAPGHVIRWFLLTRPIRFTRFGWWYIAFTLAVGGAAINTGNNLLYLVLGVLLGSIVVSGLLSDSTLWRVALRWSPTATLYAGRPALFEAELTKSRLPGLGISVTSSWGNCRELLATHFCYWIAPGLAQTFRCEIIPKRRGWMALKSVRYATRFPFGLFEKFHTQERQERWLVFPAVTRLSVRRLLGEGIGAVARPLPQVGAGSVPFSLRLFREGDSARRIHWRSSAKRRQLLVHETEEDLGGGSWLAVSAWPDGVALEALDRFIDFIASAAFTLSEAGRPVGLLTPDIRLPPENSKHHLQRLLRYLALVTPGADRHSPPMAFRRTDHVIDINRAWARRAR